MISFYRINATNVELVWCTAGAFTIIAKLVIGKDFLTARARGDGMKLVFFEHTEADSIVNRVTLLNK